MMHLLLFTLLFLSTSAEAELLSRVPTPTWSEKIIYTHINQADLQGELNKTTLDELTRWGSILFDAHFSLEDGAGRPMATQATLPTKRKHRANSLFSRTSGLDANACTSCHNRPLPGGSGDFTANVFVSEGFTQVNFDSTDPQFSNERNTNHLFGSGLVELLAREITSDLQAIRRQALKQARQYTKSVTVELHSKGIKFGFVTAKANGVMDLSHIEGIDTDLVIRPFSQKGVVTSLRQFTINALNQHHGLQANERFGDRWTGESDFDEDGVRIEVSAGDVSALVAWQATLPFPQVTKPKDKKWREAATKGEKIFTSLECTTCHIPALPLHSLSFNDPGPWNAAGTLRQSDVAQAAVYNLNLFQWAEKLQRNESGAIMIPLFGDLKRHTIADTQVNDLGNELLSQQFVERNVFITAELWGVGSTSPYGHRGNMTTLDEVIRAHGGDARNSRDAYLSVSNTERSELIAYLKSMVIEK